MFDTQVVFKVWEDVQKQNAQKHMASCHEVVEEG